MKDYKHRTGYVPKQTKKPNLQEWLHSNVPCEFQELLDNFVFLSQTHAQKAVEKHGFGVVGRFIVKNG